MFLDTRSFALVRHCILQYILMFQALCCHSSPVKAPGVFCADASAVYVYVYVELQVGQA